MVGRRLPVPKKKNPGSEGDQNRGGIEGNCWADKLYWASALRAALVIQVPQEHRRPEDYLHGKHD
jgi:hypothetical protein